MKIPPSGRVEATASLHDCGALFASGSAMERLLVTVPTENARARQRWHSVCGRLGIRFKPVHYHGKADLSGNYYSTTFECQGPCAALARLLENPHVTGFARVLSVKITNRGQGTGPKKVRRAHRRARR